ncbi:protein NYNRIN-like [Podarcis raffonei]|nr:protein NYNRIN-like [Podarcis raffonei]
MVKIQTGSRTIPFMVDTGAAHSVLPVPVSKPTKQTINIIGATGKSQRAPFLQSVACSLGGQVVQHKFLYIPECPIPLLGRDLLSKLQAQISFQPTGEVTMTTGPAGEFSLEVPLREHWRLMMVKEEEGIISEDLLQEVTPDVWAESNPPGMAKNIPPIIVKPKPFANPVAVNQYPIPRRAAEGVWVHLERLLRHGILRQCQSQWNTPLLPVKKEDGTYRPVQDLRLVNQAVETLHPNVPNPYTLLSLIPPTACCFTVLDLKDAFFCCRLAEESQPLFAFQWTDPGTGTRVQYTWTRLPQGFKNSPTLFGVALASDLSSFPTSPRRVLLQYVDDLLLACSDKDTCMEATKDLLNHLGEAGYRVSKKKAQICQPTVKYLGFDISYQQRTLREERKQAITQIPKPKNRRELRGFLGSAGFCRIWIPDYSTIAKPLHESTRGTEKDPFVWGEEQQQAFQDLKRALQQAPALGIPNPEKPFSLFVDEDQGTAKGVLCQKLGSWQQPVAYLSERLTPTEQGLPPCMRAVVAVATLLNKADKFTFGQDTVCVTPHAVPALLDMKGTYFLSQARMRKCQMLLLHPRLKFQVTTALNPATLLPVGEGEEQTHDCIEVMDEVYSSRPDLKDEANPHWPSWFVDGSSFVETGQRKAGYAVVALEDQVIEAKSLPPGTSAQLAELTALTRALNLAKGQEINIYTDSKYAFLTLHAHGALWKERGLLTSRGNQVAHPQALLNLLDAVWEPEAVAVIHCYGHKTGPGEVARGNRLADRVAKEAAQELAPASVIGALVPEEILSTADKPAYTKQEKDTADAQELTLSKEGWYLTHDDRIWIPESLSRQIIQRYHGSTHIGPDATTKQLGKCFYIAHLYQLAAQISRKCLLCQKNNPRAGPLAPPGSQHSGTAPMEDLVVDFTELPRCGLHRYLLVAVCTYTGWVEAWPTKTEKAFEVTRCLLREIIPRYGLPRSIGSDNGPAFVHAVLQGLVKALQINWKLHTAYRPQSSGKVERMNRTLKNQLSKLTQETGSNWVAMLPLALLRVRSLPSKRTHLSPFEVLFGRPVPYVRMLTPYASQDMQLNNYVQSLSQVLSCLGAHRERLQPSG